ncbi:hypothetical protein ONZ51_g8108 [Trametes cubensis]|uniref:CHAT domain-containing protein n=1 Tax=Trametes cubensis TaxID=1111947 RepID=A0AAD7TRD3_9APHY|nr:hypothetical protein ONZ51_g8108 [Trametes cubensis]
MTLEMDPSRRAEASSSTIYPDMEEELANGFRQLLQSQDGSAEPLSSQELNPASSNVNTSEPQSKHIRDNDQAVDEGPARAKTQPNEVQAEDFLAAMEPGAGARGAEDFVESLVQQVRQLNDLIPSSQSVQVPIAVVPEYSRTSIPHDRTADGGMYDGKQATISMFEAVAGDIKNVLKAVDALGDYAKPPPLAPTTSTVSSSSTSPDPAILSSISTQASRATSLLSQLSGIGGNNWMTEEVNRMLQSNELYLRATAHKLSIQLQSMSEHSPNLRETQSAFGLVLLQLYELVHDDTCLNAAMGAVSVAITPHDSDATSLTLPIRVRNWAYAERLMARRERAFDPLQHVIEVIMKTLNVHQALNLPDTSPDRRALAIELAECCLDRYHASGEVSILTTALDALRALEVGGSWTDTRSLCVLSELYLERFLRTWNFDNIDKALYYTGHMQELDEPEQWLPPRQASLSHPDASRGLRVTALCRAQRFEVVMDITDLDTSVNHARKALRACSETHPMYAAYQTTLALALYRRFEADQDARDLDECIELSGIAMHLPIHGSVVHYPAEAGYGLALARRGEVTDNLAEIDEGIHHLQRARKAFAGGTHIEARIERDLATALSYRFQRTKGTDDLDAAIRYASSALDRAPEDDQSRASLSLQIGHMLAQRASTSGSDQDHQQAVDALRSVAQGSARAPMRLKAAMEWAHTASTRGPSATLEALKVALDILPLIAWAGNRMVVQYRTLASLCADVGPWAAACAIASGNLEDAITYLERGRNVLWSQSLQLRLGQATGLSETSQPSAPGGASTDSQEAERKTLSSFLSRNADGMGLFSRDRERTVAAAQKNPEVFKVAERLRNVYENMREKLKSHPGYRPGDFDRIDTMRSMFASLYEDASLHSAAKRHASLQAYEKEAGEAAGALTPFRDLRRRPSLATLLSRGHIVLLNVHSSRCDALILGHMPEGGVNIRHVPLPELSVEDLRGWAETIQVGMYDLQQGAMGVRDLDEAILIPVLQGIWRTMAAPTMHHLLGKDLVATKPTRIWWCPTGPLALLPIHAAGPYEGEAPGLMELAVSSYIPTLHSLLRAHEASAQPFSLLAIGQPETPGQNPLPAVQKELTTIQRACARISRPLTTLVGPDATVFRVSQALPAHTWLHFSCHAHQDSSNAFASAFYMHNGPLTLGALMQLDLAQVQFAFLSACLTSAGDERLPDESIHLAAGMQFAGVRTTVATLWTVADKAAAFVAGKVYEQVLRAGVSEPDPLEAAEALHHAVGEMKAAGRPMVFWVPFLHVGI